MCDDYFEDLDDIFDDGDEGCDDFENGDEDLSDEDYQPDEFEGVDDDFRPPSIDAGPNHDDCHAGLDMNDFILGTGLGYELGLEERRKRLLRNTDKF